MFNFYTDRVLSWIFFFFLDELKNEWIDSVGGSVG